MTSKEPKKKAESVPRNRKSAEELQKAHKDSVESLVKKTESYMKKLVRKLKSKKHPLTDEEKAFVLSYLSVVYEEFGKAMTSEKSEERVFKLNP